jgi:hypothetical protein
MASVAQTLRRIKHNPLSILKRSAIEQAAREAGHVWRERELDPATTLALFVQQVIHGNTPCTQVRHIAGRTFTASAYCQARARLPLAAYQAMLHRVHEQAVLPWIHQAHHRWRGHRTFHVDGSSFSMPDTPELRRIFGGAAGVAEGCGFPVAHLLVLFSASTGLLLDAFAAPLRTGDLEQTPELHLHLEKGDMLIGDDSFSGYAHLALLIAAGLHGLFPVHHCRIVDFTAHRLHLAENHPDPGRPRSRWMAGLGKEDQIVEYFKPRSRPAWLGQEQYDALPDSIMVRELRRTVRSASGKKLTLTMVSTLLDPRLYPAEELLELRQRRWDVETNLRHLKITMGLDVLHCKSEIAVRKELCVFCLVYNLVRLLMLEAAARQRVPVERIGFADALRWMRHARPGQILPPLIVNPLRRDRLEPRCRKRRPKQYPLMNKPRHFLRKTMQKQGENA